MLGIATESLNLAKGGGNFGFQSGEILFNITRINKGKLKAQKYDGTIGECPLFFIRYPAKVTYKTIAIAQEDYYSRNKGYLTFKKGDGIYLEPETITNKYWLSGVYNGKRGKFPKYSVEFERGVIVGKRVFLQKEIDYLTENLSIHLTDKIHLTQLFTNLKNSKYSQIQTRRKTMGKSNGNSLRICTTISTDITKKENQKNSPKRNKKKKQKKSKATKREEKKQKELASRKKKFSKKLKKNDPVYDLKNPKRGISKVKRWFHRRSATMTDLEKYRNKIEKDSELQMKGLKRLNPQLVSAVLLSKDLLVLKKLCGVDKRIREGKKLSDLVVQLFQRKKQLSSLLEVIVNHEVANCKNQQTVLRSSKFTGLLASSIVTISGGEYFVKISKNLIAALLKHPKNYQVDPRYVGDKPAKIKKNQQHLTKELSKFLKAIFNSPKHFPQTLHHLCFLVKNKVQDEFPNYDYKTTIGAFIFLRYFSAALTNPRLFNATKKKKLSKDAKIAFIQIAKVLQIMANKSKFGTLSHLSILNAFVKDQRKKLDDFVCNISDESYLKKKNDNFQTNLKKNDQIEKEIARIININMIFITKEFNQVKISLQK
ncbi:ras gtpase-activating protein [Anaeramoeba flamelloides]|uniref:Ras gtpase-activating protein n=1 Tax=Anaeramoeba flamelloides TaxID=1746091 RepID=A0AAV7Y9R7_9EUKA|nr:ras gtpase-activating protein [Anaeramoeba flamelloides]